MKDKKHSKQKQHECEWCALGDFCAACKSTNVESKSTKKEKDGTVIRMFYCNDCKQTTGHVKSDWDIEKEAKKYENELEGKSQMRLFDSEEDN